MFLSTEIFSHILSNYNRGELNQKRLTCRLFNNIILRDFSRFPCKLYDELVIKIWTAKEQRLKIDYELYSDGSSHEAKYPTFIGAKKIRNANKILSLKYVRIRETISIDFLPRNIDGVEESVTNFITRDLAHLFDCVEDVWIGGPEKLSPDLIFKFFNNVVRGKHLYIYGMCPEGSPLSLYPYGLYNAKSVYIASESPTEWKSIVRFLHEKSGNRLTFNRVVDSYFEHDFELVLQELIRLFKDSGKKHKYSLSYHICITEDHYFQKLYKNKCYTHKTTAEILQISCSWIAFELFESVKGHGILKVVRDSPCQPPQKKALVM